MLKGLHNLLAQDNATLNLTPGGLSVSIPSQSLVRQLTQGEQIVVMHPEFRKITANNASKTILDFLWTEIDPFNTNRSVLVREYLLVRENLIADMVKPSVGSKFEKFLTTYPQYKDKYFSDSAIQASYATNSVYQCIASCVFKHQDIYKQLMSPEEIWTVLLNKTSTDIELPDKINFCGAEIPLVEVMQRSKPNDRDEQEFIETCTIGYKKILQDLAGLYTASVRKGLPNVDEILALYKCTMLSKYQESFSTKLTKNAEYSFAILYNCITTIDPMVSEQLFTADEVKEHSQQYVKPTHRFAEMTSEFTR